MRKIKTSIKLFVVRLKTAYEILFHPDKHWALIKLTPSEFVKSIGSGDYEVEIMMHRMVKYNVMKIMKDTANSRDDVDFLLDRANYEADAIEYAKSKGKDISNLF